MEETTGIVKKYHKSKSTCKVTFRLPKDGALTAETVMLVGEFNNWDEQSNPMKRQENGDFVTELELETGREYHFRYCLDGTTWENDWCADRYEPNPFGGYDSVVVL